MNTKYQQWINENLEGTGYGRCAEITEAMLAAFPELTRVRGYYTCPAWGKRAHWWLVDGGEVIDPTAMQFPSKGRGVYREWVEGTPEPTGMCPNCGELVYTGDTVCSDACGKAYLAFITAGF